MSVLANCRNIFEEPIGEDYRAQIAKYLTDPTADNWNDIQSILITPGETIWQAMLCIDPTFPRRGRTTDVEGNVLSEWERIPTPLEVMRAIKHATKTKGE